MSESGNLSPRDWALKLVERRRKSKRVHDAFADASPEMREEMERRSANLVEAASTEILQNDEAAAWLPIAEAYVSAREAREAALKKFTDFYSLKDAVHWLSVNMNTAQSVHGTYTIESKKTSFENPIIRDDWENFITALRDQDPLKIIDALLSLLFCIENDLLHAELPPACSYPSKLP